MRRSSEGWRRGVLLLAGLLMTTPLPGWAISTTTVQDTVYRADGSIAQGTLLVSWPSFTAADGSTVAAGSRTVTIGPDGKLAVPLTPNDGATPAGTYYTAVYHLTDGTVEKEYWVVPQLPAATVSMMRSKVVPAAVAQPIFNQQTLNTALQNATANYLPLKGGSLTGGLNLAGDPQSGLQAATKQYVDAHGVASLPAGIVFGGGGSTARATTGADVVSLWGGSGCTGFLKNDLTCGNPVMALPNGLVRGNGSSAASVATYADVTGPFHSAGVPVTTATTVISTSFNEGAAGAALNGTAPATCVSGCTGTWAGDTGFKFVSGGGVNFPGSTAASPASYATIDSGHADYTVTYNVTTTATSGNQLAVRFTAPGTLVGVNFSSTVLQIYDIFGGSGHLIGSVNGSFASGTYVVTAKGSSITVQYNGGTPIVGTLASGSPNGTASKVGFGEYTANNAVYSSMLVTYPTTTIPQLACAGYLNADGSCNSTSNGLLGTDNTGHFANLAEKQTQTIAGVTTIACDEDRGMGRFDPRCNIYAGGVFGPTPGAALQALANTLICYEAQAGKAPTVHFPPGSFSVGTATNPTLVFPTGGNYYGAEGRGGNAGTAFYATYNNHNAVQFNTGQSATCSDGQVHTANLSGGTYENLGEVGCGYGGCSNVPGDSGNYPNGGPNQGGIFIGDYQGHAHNITARNNGDWGINCNGVDTTCDNLFTQSNDMWYIFGKDNAGQTYAPSNSDYHCSVMLYSLDGQFSNVETYGFGNATGYPKAEYGHVGGICWAGGKTSLDHVFAQIDEIGIINVGASSGKLANVRIEGMQGEGLITGGNVYVTNMAINTVCRASNILGLIAASNVNFNQQLGSHCDYVDGADPSALFTNVVFSPDATLGTGKPTGGFWPGGATTVNSKAVNVPLYDFPVSFFPGQGAITYQLFAGGTGANVTGATPNIGGFANGYTPVDTTAIAETGVTGAWEGQEFTVFVPNGNANVTLKGTTAGGHWHTCGNTGADFNLAAAGTYRYIYHNGDNYPVCTASPAAAASAASCGSGNIPCTNAANTFTGDQTINGSDNVPLTLNSSDARSTAVTLTNTSTGGKSYRFSSTGSSNPAGPGLFSVVDVTDNVTMVTQGFPGAIPTGLSSIEGTFYRGADVSAGATFAVSGCAATGATGGASAGSLTSGTAGTCSFTVTMGNATAAPHGWACYANDLTTPLDVLHQTATTTTTATFSGTTASGDAINFACTGY